MIGSAYITCASVKFLYWGVTPYIDLDRHPMLGILYPRVSLAAYVL